MEVSAEAKRIMVVALGKMYSSRSQRGGLRLHRSLLLTLVMKSARDIYHEAQAAPGRDEDGPAPREPQGPASNEPRTSRGEEVTGPAADDKENRGPTVPAQLSRKRRGKAAAEPDFLPCKKAKLEQANGNCPQQLIVSAVMVDYVTCGSELGGPTGPVPLQRVVAAC